MRKAFSLATIALFILGLAACNHSNDITGIDTGKTPYASTSTAARTAAENGQKVVVMAPSQPAPKTHKINGAATQTPTPVCILRPAPNA